MTRKKEVPKKRISYRRSNRRIEVRVPESMVPKVCAACLKPSTRLNTHHWEEAFTLKEVRAHSELALKNSVQVDVPHHRIANDLKEIATYLLRGLVDPDEIQRLVDSMPPELGGEITDLAGRLWTRMRIS